MWICECCQPKNEAHNDKCQVCWQLQPKSTEKRQQTKPLLSRVQIGTKRTRAKLYKKLIPTEFEHKARDYLEYLEPESRFHFVNRLCRMRNVRIREVTP